MSNIGTYKSEMLETRKKQVRFDLQDGSNIYRILPPFKSNIIAKYWAVYWLASTRKRKSDGKPINMPVPTILQRDQNKNIIQSDPVFERIEALRKQHEAMVKANQGDSEIAKALAKGLEAYQLDKAYYLNALSPTGQIGVLKLRYTAFTALKDRLKELDKLGVDPINPAGGIFFDFKKNRDEKGKVSYSVDFHQKTFKNPETGKLVTEMVEAPMDEAMLARMESEASDLNSLFKVLSPSDQAMAATLDPSVIDRIFARPEANSSEEEMVAEEEGDLAVGTTVQAPPATTTLAAPPVSTPAVAPASVAPVGPAPTAAAVGQAGLTDFVATFLKNNNQQK